jgi:alkanesulfonate monooxygenase SsuD/methylene tetrahydromethanopterin reductase-like flavin-dependent oxidoreductase (luciferase family)
MKVSYLGPGAYAGRVERAGWPVPPELCDREIASSSLNAVLNQFQLADELGFDWISVSEHHYAPGLMTPNPLVLAAAASQRTKNVKIALLGPLMPLANPVRVAEEIAMLDSISGGRTIVLPLRGTPNEHLTYTKDGKAGETRAMTQEGVSLMIKAWTEPKPFSWRGEHFEFEHVSVWPRTVQEPHPPVFYSGNSDESIDFAAKHRLNLAIGFAPVRVVAEHVARYKERAKEAGWQPTDANVLYRARVLVTEDEEQAARIVKPTAHGDGQGGGAPGVAGFQFYGTPEAILAQVGPYHEAGVGILDLAFSGEAFGRGGTRKAMEVFAPILPRIHEIGANAGAVA